MIWLSSLVLLLQDPACGADARCWLVRGANFAGTSRYGEASQAFQKACELDPKSETACLYYGRTLYLLNRFQDAISVLKRASPSPEAHRITALSLEGLGRALDAEAEYREAVRAGGRSNPDEDPGIDYGVFLFRQGRTEASIAALEAAIARHPNSARAQLELGRSLLTLDQLENATMHLEKAVALDSKSPRAHLLLGKAYLRLGKPEAAAEHLRQGSLTVK